MDIKDIYMSCLISHSILFVIHKIEGRLKWLIKYNKNFENYSAIYKQNEDDTLENIKMQSRFPNIIFNHFPFKKFQHFIIYSSIYLIVSIITLQYLHFIIFKSSKLALNMNTKIQIAIFTFFLIIWHIFAETYHIQRLIEFKNVHRGGIFGTFLVIFFFFILVPITILLLKTS